MIRTLLSRAEALSSSSEYRQQEHLEVSKALSKNGYPRSIVNRVNHSFSQPSLRNEKKFLQSIVIPYIQGLSEAIRRAFSPVNVRVSFKPHTTLRKQLVKVKDPLSIQHRSNVVYCIPCRTCSSVYIGQTSRLLKTRIDEHKAAIRFAKTDVSAVAEHVWVHKHQIDFQSVSILAHERNTQQRLSLESWFIKKSSTINREVGTLVPMYDCLF